MFSDDDPAPSTSTWHWRDFFNELLRDRCQGLSKARRKPRRTRKMEKGDFFVLISLFLLALVFLFPFYRGRDLGSREHSSLQALLSLRQQAVDSGLVETLHKIGDAIGAIPGLRAQVDGPMILAGSDTAILWRDGSYDYAIRFLGFLDSGPALVVSPEAPGETGAHRFTWSPGTKLTEKPLENTPVTGDDQIIQSAERKARRLAQRVITVLAEAKLQNLCSMLSTNRPKSLVTIRERKFGCMSPQWGDSNYLFRISLAMTHVGLDLDLWAWPRVRGSSGFDAFFASGRSIPAQSWNMSSPYIGMDDLESIPMPGAARNRNGVQLHTKNNWVGWDGKRWFAIEIED